ncbi:MAG: small multi-drug export protein [Clostridia bacterium]
MTAAIEQFFANAFGSNVWIAVILIAMIPIVELRGAIPFALSTAFWGANALTWYEAWIYSVIGSTIPALIIVPLLVPVFNVMKKSKWFSKIVSLFDKKFKKQSDKIELNADTIENKKKTDIKKFLGVMFFVAVPFPLTGAWTGSAVSAYLNMGFVRGVSAVVLGNIIAGGIMSLLCVVFKGYEDIILYVFFALIVIVLLTALVVKLIKDRKNKKIISETKDELKDNVKVTTTTETK